MIVMHYDRIKDNRYFRYFIEQLQEMQKKGDVHILTVSYKGTCFVALSNTPLTPSKVAEVIRRDEEESQKDLVKKR